MDAQFIVVNKPNCPYLALDLGSFPFCNLDILYILCWSLAIDNLHICFHNDFKKKA